MSWIDIFPWKFPQKEATAFPCLLSLSRPHVGSGAADETSPESQIPFANLLNLLCLVNIAGCVHFLLYWGDRGRDSLCSPLHTQHPWWWLAHCGNSTISSRQHHHLPPFHQCHPHPHPPPPHHHHLHHLDNPHHPSSACLHLGRHSLHHVDCLMCFS